MILPSPSVPSPSLNPALFQYENFLSDAVLVMTVQLHCGMRIAARVKLLEELQHYPSCRKAQIHFYTKKQRGLNARESRERNTGLAVCAWVNAC